MRRTLLLTAIAAVVAASAALAASFPDDDPAAERLAARGHRDREGNDLLRRFHLDRGHLPW